MREELNNHDDGGFPRCGHGCETVPVVDASQHHRAETVVEFVVQLHASRDAHQPFDILRHHFEVQNLTSLVFFLKEEVDIAKGPRP